MHLEARFFNDFFLPTSVISISALMKAVLLGAYDYDIYTVQENGMYEVKYDMGESFPRLLVLFTTSRRF